MSELPDDDPLASVDPWIALLDGRAQLLRALETLDEADADRRLTDAPDWTVADLVTHVAAWDELVVRLFEALAAGTDELPVEAAPDDEWTSWNAAQIAAATGHPLKVRIERLHAARDALLAAASALDPALLDRSVATPWGTRDTVRSHLIAQAMHDGMHAGWL